MAETIGTIIGIIVVVIIIISPFALIAWLVIWLVRRRNRKQTPSQVSSASTRANKASAVAPPGYYEDAERPGFQRWWDGERWVPRNAEVPHAAEQSTVAPTPKIANASRDGAATSTSALSPVIHPRREAVNPPTLLASAPPQTTSKVTELPASQPVKDGDRIRGVAWIGPGQSVSIAGYAIPDAMIYVGRKLSAPQRSVEPSLINPSLRVNSRQPDTEGHGLNYWPAYDQISPESRAAYLEWLARGRRNPSAPLGYVFLFMYGLERRVLVDMQGSDSLNSELVPIRAEMQALMDVYATQSYSFQSYAKGFVDVIDIMINAGRTTDTPESIPPLLAINRWEIPIDLKIAIGVFAADKDPVPAPWALAWAWFNPEIRMRTGATRCTAEFAQLFLKEYTDTFGAGMKVAPGATKIGMTYSAASAGIGSAKLGMERIPDVFTFAKPTRALTTISESVQESLESFSRYVGRNPDGRDSLNALALLPQHLIDRSVNPELQSIRDWLTELVGTSDRVVIPGIELLKRWRPSAPANLTKAESTPLIQLLGKLHFGIEPDVRFGGPPLSTDNPLVLFPITNDFPLSPSRSYETATTLTHFAAAVGAADGEVSDHEIQTFLPSIESTLDLSAAEKSRLAAHFEWLTASPAKLTGLTKRIALLTDSQRVDLGGLLVSVAAADGRITAPEMMALTKIFGLLGLDQADIASRVFAAQSSPNAASREPITVRVAVPGAPGIPIPPRPQSVSVAPGTVVLDEETIRRTLHESASVSELLRGIFDDDQGQPTTLKVDATPTRSPGELIVPMRPSEPTPASIAGLDEAHSALVRQVASRESLSHLEFEGLAQAQNVMPIGAIDTINEVAFDVSEEPLLEGDDILTINPHALQEMLK
jgi:uncharacterized tellurite resistance protein B-like protein